MDFKNLFVDNEIMNKIFCCSIRESDKLLKLFVVVLMKGEAIDFFFLYIFSLAFLHFLI